MSAQPLDVQPTVDEDRAAEMVYAAIHDLPPESHEVVERQLSRVVVQYDRTGLVDPALRFLRNLVGTARLHRHPEYRKALAEADAEGVDPDGRDVTLVVAELRELAAARRAG